MTAEYSTIKYIYMGLLQSGMAKYCSKRQLDRLWQIIIPEDKSIY
jgi:hypothetical protein